MAAMSKTPDAIDLFVRRAAAFCAKHGRSRTWLSKRLFQDTNRLKQLEESKSTDIGVRKLAAAQAALDQVEREAEGSTTA